ncbi:MAG: hypothetical protein HY902_12800 [Deltaproteobacteria bacterium]|nr:hypothetical protein [Deltaproteobacteria bacterium]
MNSKTSRCLASLGSLLLWTLVVGALLACGKTEAPPASDSPAGEVEAVEGAVTAQRATAPQPRALTVKAPVYADDTVTTPLSGSVTIRLLHNLAQWHLEGGLSKRVDQSAAFAAPRDAAPQPLANKAEPTVTASAGRHSEHEAAGSAESAVRAPEPAPVAAPPPAPAPSEGPQAAEKAAEKKAAPSPAKKAALRAEVAKTGVVKAFDVGGGVSQAPSPPPGSGSGSGAKKDDSGGLRKADSGGDVEVVKAQLQVAQEAVRGELSAAMNKLRGAMANCAELAVRQGLELPPSFKVLATLGTEGKLTQVEVEGLSGGAAQCVKSRWQTLRGLPTVDAPVAFTVTYGLKLADM